MIARILLALALLTSWPALAGPVVGNVASGTADVGYPVKTGCRYNASAPTFSDGNRADQQCDVHGNALSVLVPSTSGGLSIFGALVTNSAQVPKGSAGQLYGWHVFSTSTAVCYLQVYNSATPAVGVTAPMFTIGLPIGGQSDGSHPMGIQFTNAIAVAATSTRSGSTACTTGGIEVALFYK